ncbi:SAM-dependent methyltransferase [Spirillospora sp. NBC_00431]
MSIARVYDYFNGGKDNYTVDREFAAELTRDHPYLPSLVRDNRAFLKRAVSFLAHVGIRQFLDIGTGLPTQENVHEVAQRIAPESRIVYVDCDPTVLTHARALLTSAPEGRTGYVEADARDVETIVREATAAGIDFTRPVAVLLLAILHFLPDEDATAPTAAFRAAVADGSPLVISHGAPGMRAVADAYQKVSGTGTVREPEQIRAFFGDWDLYEPGLVPLPGVPQKKHQDISSLT